MNEVSLTNNMDFDSDTFPKSLSLEIDSKKVFGFKTNMKIFGFKEKTKFVPEIDASYLFDEVTTKAILAGFSYNRRVMIQGYHGTGKSTHIEQVAARLNWPCVRVNLDSHISRLDLVGKDAIVLKDGKQITEFREGVLPWALQNKQKRNAQPPRNATECRALL